ncbi:MAG: VanZ family protein [Deltaproteobacteria bacterium]|nr:VanZ family protein [Deltaproteobacteria bacterium]
MKKRYTAYLPATAYMAVILVLSIRPAPQGLPDLWEIDKLYHFISYAIMGCLWARALDVKGRGINSIIIPAALISAVFGAFVEVCQAFVPMREASVLDALANGLGGTVGAFVCARVRLRRLS